MKFAFIIIICFTALATDAQQKKALIMWGTEKECKSATSEVPVKPHCDFFVVDGQGYRVLFHDYRTIAVTFATDGGYLLADVFVENLGNERFLMQPEKWATFGYKDEAASLANQKPLFQSYAESPRKIANKIESRARWGAFFTNLSGAFATTSASIQGHSQDSSGNYATYSGTITAPDDVAKRQAAITNERNKTIAATKADSILELALRANTMLPDSRVAGRVYFKKGKAHFFEVYMPIGETVYLFTVKEKNETRLEKWGKPDGR